MSTNVTSLSCKKFGYIKLHASDVGLPFGHLKFEVGHMNIGIGNLQDILRIDKSFENGTFEKSNF